MHIIAHHCISFLNSQNAKVDGARSVQVAVGVSAVLLYIATRSNRAETKGRGRAANGMARGRPSESYFISDGTGCSKGLKA